jgi:Bacterial tandem repeat domain 1
MTNRPFPSRMASRQIALAAAAVALLFTAPLPAADKNPDYTSLAGVKAPGIQKWLDDAKEQGYQPYYINGYDVGDHAEFAGVAVKDPDKRPFEARFDMTSDEYQQWIDEMRDKGYRPPARGGVSGYMAGKSPRFAAVWVKDGKYIGQWKTCHNQGQKDFDETVTAMHKDGLEPSCVTAYLAVGGSVRYTGLFWKRPTTDTWECRHDLTAAQLQENVDRWASKGFQLKNIHAYNTPDGLRFLAIAESTKKNHFVWQERHGMTGNEYQKEFDELGKEGYRPGCICGYREDGEVRFAAIWMKEID